MRAVALHVLAITAIVHSRVRAGPWKHNRRDQRSESRQGADDDFDAFRGFTARVGGGDGVVNPPVGNGPLPNLEIASQGQHTSNRQQPADDQLLPNIQQASSRQTAIANGFENLRISTVTVTAQFTSVCSPAPQYVTITVTSLAKSLEQGDSPATVTITQLQSTVTQTIIASCATNNPQSVNDALPANPSGERPQYSARPEPQATTLRLRPVTGLPSTVTEMTTVAAAPPSAGQRISAGGVDQVQSSDPRPDLVVVVVGDDHDNGQGPKAVRKKCSGFETRKGYPINRQPILQTGHAAAVEQCVFGTMRGESQVTCDDGSTIPIVEGMVSTVEPSPIQTQIEVLPMTSANDNWSGVLIVPIAESALPTTTYLIPDPAPAPSTVVAESKPLPTSSLNQSEPLGASASTLAAHPVSIIEPTVSLPEPSSSSSYEMPTTLKTALEPTGTVRPTNSPPTPTSVSSSSSTSSVPNTAVPFSSTATSGLSAFPTLHLAESLALGRLGPSPTKIKDSVVAPALGGTVPGSGVVAPAQPAINLSGLSLSSYQDLGSLYNQDQLA
ncbi:hypothetical protein E4U43_008192 [Claviceps pusilla]|uniref:Uncharacterized protein n=1 Tax=Claviceps pusilla TaxID=123648 RepID=A0A9P7NC88_9HYPO|nr:hypothetical protein E4U43_008192 [Claviceps pusilla]